jgi:UDP-glucose 4-epimerase
LAGLLGFDQPPRYGAERRGDVRDSLADIGAAAEALGYRPLVGFEEGLRRTVEWYVRQTRVTS